MVDGRTYRNLRNDIAQGISVAFLLYVIASGVVPLLFTSPYAQSPPLFSVTLIVPSGRNTVRQQYAKDIANSMIAEGIDAKLVTLNFSDVVNRMLFSRIPAGSTYDQGGYDIAFIGWSFTSPVLDFRSNFDGRPAFLAPNGNNYALYNNPQLNALFDTLYGTTDVSKQVDLTRQAEAIIFHDAPYNYIYETIDPVPRGQEWTDFGGKNVYSEVTFPDVQHWASGSSLTFAEANPVFPGNTLNPVVTASSNSFQALYIYGAIVGGALQEVDSRDMSFYPGTASSITSSANGLDWNVTIKHGVLFQSGVEVTADDFVWTQWAWTNPAAASVNLSSNVQYLGNVIDFTFLNGTKVTIDNRAKPTDSIQRGSWKANSKYSFSFHLPAVYPFTRQVYGAFAPLPKHIMEKFNPATWDGAPFSTASGAYTYTWDASKYGGSGKYTAVGPVGAGPYYMTSYDFTANIATMKKFPQYYNATGLQALGQFTVDTYKVVWISSKNSAITALKNGEVNVLDYSFAFQTDVATLKSIGANIITAPELGWQEQGFNMQHPIFGTGVDTPLGKSNPSQAAEAARHVRKAISHLINRSYIVNQLLGGFAYPLATMVGPGWGPYYDANLSPDTYDMGAAADELRAAGYNPTITATASVTSSTISQPLPTTSLQTATTTQNTQQTVQSFQIGQNNSILAAIIIVAVVLIGFVYSFRGRLRRRDLSVRGSRAESIMLCPQCHAEIPSDSEFCLKCGANIRKSDAIGVPYPGYVKSRKSVPQRIITPTSPEEMKLLELLDRLEKLHNDGKINEGTYRRLREDYEKRLGEVRGQRAM